MSAKNVLKLCFCCLLAVGFTFTASSAKAADRPEYVSAYDSRHVSGKACKNCQTSAHNRDGSLFPSGECDRCKNEPKRKVRIVDGKGGNCPSCPTPEFRTQNYVFAKARYNSNVDRDCCDLASFALTNVDFKLNGEDVYNPYSNHVGNYRFRIFGCRRQTKKAMLDHGRIIQNNMDFQSVFKKSADKCYKVMEMPNVCLEDRSVILPEYVLTAEITDFFMNVCDEYDWQKAQKNNRRDGSAEMTVTWRLMNLSQSRVYWKGVTTGYAELENGVYEGEVKLAELAFSDAAARLSSLPGFEAQLQVRQTQGEIEAERAALIAFDAKFNPNKCPKAAPKPQCPAATPSCPMAHPICPCATQQPCICTQPNCTCPMVSCPCAAQQFQAAPKVEEFVDVKTEKTVIEKKIITTTRVETPQPVCRQVCQPLCPQPACQVKCTRECQQPRCRKVCTKACEEGTNKCTETCKDDCGEPVKPQVEEITYTPVVEQKGDVEIKNEMVEPQIEEKGGVEATHRVYDNCIDENGNVITDGSCVTPKWVELEGYTADSKLCVVDREPYAELSPENMLKIRGSVAEITNVANKKGVGLLLSDSLILTSADLVNKNHNTYDVKLLNGEIVKAKAVRVNPSKNIALMQTAAPVAYTPLALNMDLPAIDQEGFIALGLLGKDESPKNYMDDSGKIYGYRYTENLGTEIIVDTLVQKVSKGSVLIDRLGTVNGISNAGQQTKEGMDLFMPTESALKSVGVTICEKLYDKTPAPKPVTEQVKQETKAPEAMPEQKRK